MTLDSGDTKKQGEMLSPPVRTTELRHQILNFQSRYKALSPLPPFDKGGGERACD